MNRIERAELLLRAAQARHPTSCLPGSAWSPADALGTLTLPRQLIAECDRAAGQQAAAAGIGAAGAARRVDLS